MKAVRQAFCFMRAIPRTRPQVISASVYSQCRPVDLTCHLYVFSTTEWKLLELMGCGIVTPDCSDRSPWTRAKHPWHGPFRVHTGLLSGVLPAGGLTVVTFQRRGSYCSHRLLRQGWQGENTFAQIYVLIFLLLFADSNWLLWQEECAYLFIYLLFLWFWKLNTKSCSCCASVLPLSCTPTPLFITYSEAGLQCIAEVGLDSLHRPCRLCTCDPPSSAGISGLASLLG